MKTKLISTCLVLCVAFVLLVLCSCRGGGDDTLITCGDGVIDTDLGETCDDGNTDDGDDCPADCILVSVSDICGDGTQGLTEECDDANIISEDGCSSVCKLECCGDGTVQTGLGEVCDDGNLTSNDGCSSICQVDTVVTSVTTETLCSDGLDDDSDGTIDCADSDCAADAACDADGDGTLDSSDTETDATSCADGLDNEGDGLVDCADSDCLLTTTCDFDQDGITNASDDDIDGDGNLNEADSDQDGDGLCDNALLCSSVVDIDITVINRWYFVRRSPDYQAVSGCTEITANEGETYTFFTSYVPNSAPTLCTCPASNFSSSVDRMGLCVSSKWTE